MNKSCPLNKAYDLAKAKFYGGSSIVELLHRSAWPERYRPIKSVRHRFQEQSLFNRPKNEALFHDFAHLKLGHDAKKRKKMCVQVSFCVYENA